MDNNAPAWAFAPRRAYLTTVAFAALLAFCLLALDTVLDRPLTAASIIGHLVVVLLVSAVLLLILNRQRQRHAQAQRASERTAATLHFALRASRGGLWEFTPRPGSTDIWDGELKVSDEAKALLGFRPDELADGTASWLSLIHPDDAPGVMEQAAQYHSGNAESLDALYRARQKDGSYRWVNARGVIERNANGSVRRLAGITWDMDDLQTQRQRATVLGALFDTSPEGVILADADRRIVTVNRTLERLSGYPAGQLSDRLLEDVLFTHGHREVIDAVLREVDLRGSWTGVIDCTRANGQDCRAEVRISVSRDANGRVAQYGVLVFDITELETSRSQLTYLQNYDALTRLPNRQLVQHQLGEALRLAIRAREGLAVLAIGIDRFHVINETLGRSFGDRLLGVVGERLGSAVEHVVSAGRLHGDCFALVIDQVTSEAQTDAIAERVRKSLSAAYALDGETVHLSVCIGLAQFPQDGVSADALLLRAESALDDAKHSVRQRQPGAGIRRYRAELSDLATDRIHIETNLRKALLSGGLECHFQPKVRLESGAWIGAEALIRWRMGDCWISPARFIPVAEQSGLIKDLGRWILWEAATTASAWRREGIIGDDFQVAVNLASAQLDRELPATVRGVLDVSGLPPGSLMLELTETILMTNPVETATVLRALRERGVSVSLDDFGTGYTSMTQLLSLPLDELKLDQSFVRGLPEEQGAHAIVSSVLAMAQSLGLRCVAEGIETEAQRKALIGLGCRYGQGHLFGAAIPAQEFEEALRRERQARA